MLTIIFNIYSIYIAIQNMASSIEQCDKSKCSIRILKHLLSLLLAIYRFQSLCIGYPIIATSTMQLYIKLF